MRVTTVLVTVFLKFSFSTPTLNHLQMVTDVITAFDQPTTVVAKLCWKTLHKNQLTSMLARSKKSVTIRFSTETVINNNDSSNNHLLFLVETHCPGSKEFMNQANELGMYSKVYRWLVIGKANLLMDELADLNILVDSEFIIAEELDDKGFILLAVYKIKANSEWIIEHYGTWSLNDGLNKSEDRFVSNAMRRKDLRGESVSASVVIPGSKTTHDPVESRKHLADPYIACSYITVTTVYDYVNATINNTFTDTWGYLVNGTWTGMMGIMHRGEADICGSLTFITKERLALIDYVRHPASMPMSLFVFRQPPLSYEHNLFLLPFTSGVWYSLGGFTIILIMLLYVTAKWDIKKYEEKKKKPADQTCLRATWSDIIIFVLSAVSQQGSSNELKGNLGRLVMFVVFLCFVFFYTSYSANIIVLLQSTSDKIRTISDLTNSELEIGVEDTTYNRYYFSAAYARDPVRKAFYETKVAPKNIYMSLEEGIKRMQKKPFAFQMNVGLGYKIVAQFFKEHEKCGLQEIDYIQIGYACFATKKNSPFSEIFRVSINRFQEHGISDRQNRILFARKPQCAISGGNFESVSMIDFYPVVLLLLYGMILSFIFLGLEILYHHGQKMKKDKN